MEAVRLSSDCFVGVEDLEMVIMYFIEQVEKVGKWCQYHDKMRIAIRKCGVKYSIKYYSYNTSLGYKISVKTVRNF